MRHLFAILTLTTMLGLFAWRPVHAQSAMGPGYYDQDFFLFNYDGTWTPADSELCSDGDRYRADSTGAYVEFEIWGDGFTWYSLATSGPTGLISVCIDSVCNSVSHYAGGAMVGLEFSHTGLGYGVHEIALVQNTGLFSVCGVLVHPPAPQPTLPPQEIVVELTFVPVQPTIVVPQQPIDYRHLWTINDQVVAFDYQVSAGDVSLMMFLAVVSLFLFVAALIYLLRRPAQ